MSKRALPAQNPNSTALTVVTLDLDPNLPENLREELAGAFLPLYAQLQDMEAEFESITGSETTVHTKALSKKAAELRKKYVAWRGAKGLKGVHEEKKAYYRLVGSSIDSLERIGRTAAMEREEKLREIEEFAERELQRERSEQLLPYLQEGTPMRTDLGTMSEDMWEGLFLVTRKRFQEAAEAEVKRVLKEAREKETAPYSLCIEHYDEIVWEDMSEKAYKVVLETAKGMRERELKEAEYQKERARIAEEKLQKQQEEEAAKQKKFTARVASVKGGELREDGIYYKDKKVVTLKSIQEKSDEDFAQFITVHTQKFNADVALENERKEAEEKAKKEMDEQRNKMMLEEARLKAEKEANERKAREEQEKKEAAEAAAEAAKKAPDREKLLELRDRIAAMEYPGIVSPNGNAIVEKLKEHFAKAVSYIEGNLDKI